jgi:hypothetical protein
MSLSVPTPGKEGGAAAVAVFKVNGTHTEWDRYDLKRPELRWEDNIKIGDHLHICGNGSFTTLTLFCTLPIV